MKHLFSLLVFVLTMLSLHAEPITREQAQKKAEEFMKSRNNYRRLAPVTNQRKLAPGRRNAPLAATSEYYVFNKGTREGFVIVSGDDQTTPVLGYCDEGEFNYAELPPNMQEWLDGYERQIAAIQQGAPYVGDAVPTHPKVAQLMKSKWSQGNPYNLTCPMYFSLGRSVTGCVATAMAQILYYNREKSVSETTAAMPAYETWNSHETYGKLHVEGIPEGAPIDWENMKDEYGGSATDKQKLAVADLMHYCGVAVKMGYSNSSSGAQSHDAYLAFGKYFGYGSSVRYVSYSTVSSDVEWDRIVYADIAEGRPVYVSGSNSSAGHAFVADGYDGNLRYHINWGWGGTSDGYYLLTQLTPGQQGIGGSNDGYNDYREIIVGIEPENYGEKAMSFADATVKSICLANFDANGDGKLTYGEAAAVTDLGTVFKGTGIKTFKELYYFTAVKTLPDDAFNGCAQLTNIRLPKEILSIGARSLKGCSKLSRLDMPNHVKTIGAEAFAGCSLLTTITLPDELPELCDGVFAKSGITTISLPITVATIGAEAFADCPKLTNVDVKTFLPANIKLNATAFSGTDLSKATLNCMQGTKAYFSTADVWKEFGTIVEKREISAGNFADLEVGKTYYLYHVGTGQYLTKGEAWGTQAVVGSEPMRFTVSRRATMPEGVYYLTSDDTGKDGKYLFRTSTDSNVGTGIIASFVDGSELTANVYWRIQSAGDKVFTIQIPAGGSGYADGKFWGVQTDHRSNAASPTYGVYADIVYADHPTNCQWRFVLYDETEVKKFKNAQVLGNLLVMAKDRRLKTEIEQAVYDNLQSTADELRSAQRSLRKKLNFIDFADDYVGQVCVSLFDIDTDGELSYSEAAKVNDLGWMFYSYFYGKTTLVSFDELQYFTSVPSVYGNTFEGCTNLESVVLPKNLTHLYYRAFLGCKKLQEISIPEFVNTIGDDCFNGCSALRTVTCFNPNPANISLGGNVFAGVPLKECTLRVPFGTKKLYENAEVWKEFGKIIEVRGHMQPKFSPVEADVPGYVFNLSTRKFIAMGEAYGTQSVVAGNGILYQFKHSKSMADSVYYLADASGKVVFRTNTDKEVGDGVPACFGDGSVSTKAYWRISNLGDNVFTMQVPENDANYVEGKYLGVSEDHQSSYASPTYGLYWDLAGAGTEWAFITKDDLDAARLIDAQAETLAEMLKRAEAAQVDAKEEQAVYDNSESTADDLRAAIVSVRAKLNYITFNDDRVRNICLDNWDSDYDGELTFDEAARITTIGETFRGASNIKSFPELRYFTALTEIPANAFRSAMSLETVYLPASVKSIGDYAFTGCSVLKYLVVLNDQEMIPLGVIGIPNKTTLFVPAAQLDAYQNDEAWTAKCTVVEYTGKPVVTAQASRVYGRRAAAVDVKVLGAPIDGTPEYECAYIADATTRVGTYPIVLTKGTITTLGVELRDGIFTVEPAPLTITAKSYTRYEGQDNPEFELTIKGYRNRETDTVFTVRPIVTCEATKESPAGEYDIVVSGAEAWNYAMTYENGKLTVLSDPAGIHSVEADEQRQPVYDLQGRRVAQPRQSGVYLKGKRKIFVK